MYNKRWIYKTKEKNTEKTDGIDPVKYLSETYGIPEFAAEICAARGVETKEQATAYFTDDISYMTDPFSMKGMDEAVERISEAVDNGETITVFGDYDADGVTATSILYKFLSNQTDATVYFKVPDRIKDGYGLSENAVREMAQDGTSLVITVDCGIKSVKEIALAYELGMEVVVTDHHTRGEVLPDCKAIINPIFEDESSPLKNLCGAGVAYKLCEALCTVFGCDDEELYGLIAMAAVGTTADEVNLLGENRLIVKKGLEYIRSGINPGVTALYVNEKNGDISKITLQDLAFTVNPRINAAGRMGDASRAVELLTTPDKPYAVKIASELISDNELRKKLEAQIFTESLDEDHLMSAESDFITVSLGEGWHHGVIGIVASRVTEKTGKPSFIFATEENNPGVARGSARSIEGFDLRSALAECEDLLIKFGGHEMAAGLSVEVENMGRFIAKMNEYYKENVNEQGKILTQNVDCILPAGQITPENFEALMKLQPFGHGNTNPVIATADVEVCEVKYMGEGNRHVRIKFRAYDESGNPFEFSGVKFNVAGVPMPFSGEKCSILYNANVNVWQGRKSAEPYLIDIFEGSFSVENEEKRIYNEKYITNSGFYLSRGGLVIVFKILKAMGGKCGADNIGGIKMMAEKAGRKLTAYQIVYGLKVFCELGFAVLKNGTFEIVPDARERKLEESELFRALSEKE